MGLAFAAAASHGFLDTFTNGGLGVGFFIPFWNERFFFPWRPINVSPIGLRAFLRPSGAEALYSEIVWIWLPLSLVWILAFVGVAVHRSRSS